MQLYPLQILAETGLDDIFNEGAKTAQSISESWDNQWLNLLQNDTGDNIYRSLTNLGIFFAVGTFLVFMMQWLKDLINSEYSSSISALIWPFLVILLLTHTQNGSILSTLTLSMRNFLNTVNQQVFTKANANQNYQQVMNMSVAEEFVGSLIRQCESLTGENQIQCLTKANDKAHVLWQEYRNLYGEQIWITRLETEVNQIADNTENISEINFNVLIGSTVQTSIKSFLISLQYAFQNSIEATMLLIAALGPIAVGCSLLPVAGKPIFAWIIGFISLGIAKISFNIMAILTTSVIMNGPGQDINTNPDLMWVMIFLGILAPLISLSIAIVGGLSIFNAITNSSFAERIQK